MLEAGNPSNVSITSSASNPGSHLSLHSDSSEQTHSGFGSAGAIDNPEALEVLKQQKDLLEQGIEMYAISTRTKNL